MSYESFRENEAGRTHMAGDTMNKKKDMAFDLVKILRAVCPLCVRTEHNRPESGEEGR